MRRISANIIITNTGVPLKNGIIELNENNIITNIIDTKGQLKETENLEYYNGVIVPGFVNAHCHLELSHMKGILTKGKELPSFIREIISTRFTPANLPETLKIADKKLRSEGIVACGDISNATDTFELKKNSEIYYHTFAEVFTIGDEKAETAFARGKELIKELKKNNLPGTIVPHAPYSVPSSLYKQIADQEVYSNKIISVHNQETISENELFLTKKGELHDILSYSENEYANFNFSGKNSLQSTLEYLPTNCNILLIHNSFSTTEDINYAEEYSTNIYWTLCPNSNLYIENRLPNIPLFFSSNIKVCFGTDSLASNDSLSILDELITVHRHFPELPLEKLIFAATQEGANALMVSDTFGSIEKGKAPGLNLILGIDLKTLKLTGDCSVKVLV